MFKIMGKYKRLPKEEIDTAEDKKEAEYLLSEYMLAYSGQGWRLWYERS